MTFQNEASSIFDLFELSKCKPISEVCFQVEMESTNDVGLKLLAQAENTLPALVLCESQRAGRGRGENQWESSPGALTFSLLLDPIHLTGVPITLLSLAAGLSIQRTIVSLFPELNCKIKWPNDVLINRGKVAGILIESKANGIVVGIGINVSNELLNKSAISLTKASGKKMDMQCILLKQLEVFFQTISQLKKDPASVLASCESAIAWLGEQIEMTTGRGPILGFFLGLDQDGRLILQTESETKLVASATSIRPSKPH